jgi:hypothetical protein
VRVRRRVFGKSNLRAVELIRSESIIANVGPTAVQQESSRGNATGRLRLKPLLGYGFGLAVVVVVVSVFVSVLVAGEDAVFTVFVDWVFVSVLVEGARADVLMDFLFSSVGVLTTLSVFFSTGAGTTVSVFCSHAPRSAALARMQINFFIVVDWLPVLGLSLNRNTASFRPC